MLHNKLVLILTTLFFLLACQKIDAIPKVEDANLQEIEPSLFTYDEWYIPYYLHHFGAVANSVVDSGEERGFFDLSVWRGTKNHHNYNARVMEGILSLVWFYCTNKPWNKYYADKALKLRIEASLTYWSDMQNYDGRFSEYSEDDWRLAPTAFATKFLGRALWLLAENGPDIDKQVFDRARETLRKAIYYGLKREDFWNHGTNYTNQYANFWGGALSYLAVWPDDAIKKLLIERIQNSMVAFQSKSGFFYEHGAIDWEYNLNTHHSDLQAAWEYADRDIRELLITKTKRWYDWFSFNAVLEPNSNYYYLNRAIETRQRKGLYNHKEVKDPAFQRWTPQAEFVPVAHAFLMSVEEYKTSARLKYNKMLAMYPTVKPLNVGEFNAFTPYAFMHHGMENWLPSVEQKKASIQRLPYIQNKSFMKSMYDAKSQISNKYFKTPNYYAIFNSGKIATDQQRYGLGLIWTPSAGTIFQSQSRSNIAAWGTKADGSEKVYEANDLFIKESINSTEKIEPFIPTAINYELGDKGNKKIAFTKQSISVTVWHENEFLESIPVLLRPSEELVISDNMITLRGNETIASITVSEEAKVFIEEAFVDENGKICKVILIESKNELSYKIVFK